MGHNIAAKARCTLCSVARCGRTDGFSVGYTAMACTSFLGGSHMFYRPRGRMVSHQDIKFCHITTPQRRCVGKKRRKKRSGDSVSWGAEKRRTEGLKDELQSHQLWSRSRCSEILSALRSRNCSGIGFSLHDRLLTGHCTFASHQCCRSSPFSIDGAKALVWDFSSSQRERQEKRTKLRTFAHVRGKRECFFFVCLPPKSHRWEWVWLSGWKGE